MSEKILGVKRKGWADYKNVPVISLEQLEKEIDVVLADACKGETTEANKKSYSVFATALKGHFRIKAKIQAGEK